MNQPILGILQVESPKDGIVEKIFPVDGAHVLEGETLFQLDTIEEDRALERIRLSAGLIGVEENYLSVAQVALRRRVFEIAVELTKAYVDFANRKLKWDHDAVLTRTAAPIIEWQSEAGVTKANKEYEKANLALESFDFNITQAKERTRLIKEELPREERHVQTKIAQSALTCPRTGTIALLIGKSSFVKKGHILCTIK